MTSAPGPSAERAAVVLDVDTGVDDALALLLACLDPRFDLRGVVATAGNVPLDVALRNTRLVLAAAGRADVRVAAGAATTLDGRAPRGPSRHGPDGLAGLTTSGLLADVVLPAASSGEFRTRHAARPVRGSPLEVPAGAGDLLRRALPGAALVLLAPQSSAARALRADPRLLDGAVEVVAAAGSLAGRAEFNGDHDRVARAEVAAAADRSGVPRRDVPVEVARAGRWPGPACDDEPAGPLVAALLRAWNGSAGDATVLASLLPRSAIRS